MLAVMLGAPEGKRYRSPVLRYFGQISYALYLVHQPISGLLHGVLLDSTPDVGTLPQLGVTVLAFAVSVAVAAASWTWLERPILKSVPSRHRAALARHPLGPSGEAPTPVSC
jgi:peptidoglycan/LPS O-acetylase OafA/YrhL